MNRFNEITVICNKPHDIDPTKCAFCEIERLTYERDGALVEAYGLRTALHRNCEINDAEIKRLTAELKEVQRMRNAELYQQP